MSLTEISDRLLRRAVLQAGTDTELKPSNKPSVILRACEFLHSCRGFRGQNRGFFADFVKSSRALRYSEGSG